MEFHRTHYHPRNARVFLYGNIPAERYLEFLQEEFLQHFESGSAPNPIGSQPRWSEPRRIVQRVPGQGDPEATASVTLNWLLFPAVDAERVMAFEVLSEILLGTPGSPLQKRLLESGLGEDLSSPSGYESEIFETTFSVGLRGTSARRVEEIEAFVLHSIAEIIQQGFDPDLVEGTLRRFEFRTRELGSGGNVGLHLMRRAYQGWMHGATPWETLEFSRVFAALRQRIAQEPGYLGTLLQEYLLDNPHRLTVAVVPDPAREQEDADRRRQYLAELEAGHGPDDRERILREEEDLRRFQEQPDPPEAVAALPRLELDDVPREIRVIPQEVLQLRDGVSCCTTAIDSRGIVYLNIALEVGDLDGEAELLLPFLSATMTGLGVPGIPYDQMSHRIGLVFGGFRSDIEVTDHAETQQPHAILWLRTKFLAQYADEALDLIDQVLCRADFSDTARLREMLVEQRNDYRSSIIHNGSGFAGLRADAGLSQIELKEERLKGITQYLYLDALLQQPIEAVRAGLERLHDTVVRRCRTELQLTCDPGLVGDLTSRIPRQLGGLWAREYSTLPDIVLARDFREPALPAVGRPEALVTSTTVNFIAMALPGSLVFQPEFAAQTLISHLLSTSYLWERCRMQGGAYGASASLNGLSGIFRFVTYRDPQTTASLQAFLEAFSGLETDGLDPELIETAVIALVGKELRPLSPGAQGLIAYRRRKFGITDELRQENRDRLLGLTPGQVTEQLQSLGEALQQAVVSMVSSQDALQQLPADTQDPAAQLLRLAAENQIRIISG